MGRPREHDDETRAALLRAAEAGVSEGGPDALSLRAVARDAGTTTRAVYSLFGSKEGLLAAVAQLAFAHLAEMIEESPETKDPARDLVTLGAKGYRRFVRDHASVYRLAFQRIAPDLELGPEFFEARQRTWVQLERKVQRLKDAGLLHGRSVRQAAVEFNAVCEGLANAELRGGTMVSFAGGDDDTVWLDTFEVLVGGFGVSPRRQRSRNAGAGAST